MDHTLKTIKNHIDEVLKHLSWTALQSPSNANMMIMSNLSGVRYSISLLEILGLFDSVTDELNKTFIYTTSNDAINVNISEGQAVNTILRNLRTSIEQLFQALNKIVPVEDPLSINIKLPPVNDFEDLSIISRDLHIALTQVLYIDEVGGKVKIESVENGSIWLNIIVGGAEVVPIVASLAWSAAVIYKKVLEGRVISEYIRSLKIKNESLDDLLGAQKASTALLIQAEAEHIQTEHFQDNLPENVERIKNSLKLLSELIEKGAVIQPALMAPENVKNLFPDTKNVTNLESKIKRLNS